jgi:hypothetical protein
MKVSRQAPPPVLIAVVVVTGIVDQPATGPGVPGPLAAADENSARFVSRLRHSVISCAQSRR